MNVLRLSYAILVSSAFPEIRDLVGRFGHRAIAVDVSELHKAESGVTCMSLIFPSVHLPAAEPDAR